MSTGLREVSVLFPPFSRRLAATLAVVGACLAPGGVGCAGDEDCARYCEASAANLDRCLPDWGWSWDADIGFSGPDEWIGHCTAYWQAQVEGARERSDEAAAEVSATCTAGAAYEESLPSCEDLLGA